MEKFKERFDRVLLKSLKTPPETINSDMKFKEDLKLDSLDMIELVIEFEKEFSIRISDEMAEKILTVADAENIVGIKSLNSDNTDQ